MKKIMSSKHRIIMNAEANMRAERFIVTKEAKNDCQTMLNGQTSANELVAKYVAQYSKKQRTMTDYFTGHDDVLENKLGIDDPELLRKAESDIVFVRLVEFSRKPIQGAFDFAHLKAIHKHLFSDIYAVAGKVRTVDLAKNGSVFCYVQNIDNMQQEIFDRLKRENYLQGLEKKDFILKLAELSGDLNALHPFREGNGRTIRCFLMQLANEAGYELLYENAEKDELLQADITAFGGNLQRLLDLYEKIIHPI